MSKGIGEKLLGLFIEEEKDPSEAPRTEEPAEREEVQEAPKKTTPPPVRAKAPSTPVATPVVSPGSHHDDASFAMVYRRAGLPDSDRDRLAKVIGLVESLPSEATPEVKRAIVGASLSAFGVPIDGVVGTGNAAVAALDAYVIEGQRRTQEVLEDAESRIAKLTAEIQEVRRLMTMQVESQQELARATATERARVRVAIDFFDASRSADASSHTPRLRRVL